MSDNKIKLFPGVHNRAGGSGIIHTCNTCGKQSTWNESWSWFYKIHGKGYTGWEEEIKSCSDKCAHEAHLKYRKKGRNIR